MTRVRLAKRARRATLAARTAWNTGSAEFVVFIEFSCGVRSALLSDGGGCHILYPTISRKQRWVNDHRSVDQTAQGSAAHSGARRFARINPGVQTTRWLTAYWPSKKETSNVTDTVPTRSVKKRSPNR